MDPVRPRSSIFASDCKEFGKTKGDFGVIGRSFEVERFEDYDGCHVRELVLMQCCCCFGVSPGVATFYSFQHLGYMRITALAILNQQPGDSKIRNCDCLAGNAELFKVMFAV